MNQDMLILEEPYVSDLLLEWASDSHHPVLMTTFTEGLSRTRRLNLIDDAEAIERINSGESICSNSENALEWVLSNSSNESLCSEIRLFKDKKAMREALRPLSPRLYFKGCDKMGLYDIDPASLPLPVVLKPSVGFCSMGVYMIESEDDWAHALSDIEERESLWATRYPQSVISTGQFIIEGYIDGPEYAIDMYYDKAGRPHILNIMHHVFAGPEDTSDRIYNTSQKVIDDVFEKLEEWLSGVQSIVGVTDFPAHVEVRIAGDGTILPIEFNPLRFAGLGGTDLAYYAWGIRTYADYLEGRTPDLRKIASEHPGEVYTMSLLNPHPTADLTKGFDYDGLEARFSDILGFHRFDANDVGSYGFLFLRTDESSAGELDYLLHADLLEFQR